MSLLALAPAALAAQEAAPAYRTGYHIVRPGETLRGITAAYLGTQELWQRNLELNPQIRNPDVLSPGQRIQVLLEPAVAVPSARLVSISGKVEERPSPIDWNPAREDDLMVAEDAVRTAEASSTALQFQDGTDLLVTEGSIVFLRRSGRTLEGVRPKSVEIVEGQADIQATTAEAARIPVEIVVGDTRALQTAGGQGRGESRARKSADGGAQVMVFEGAGEVTAGGAKVDVPRGMGTNVPRGAPPAPPEKLLPAPAPVTAPGAEVEVPGTGFEWEPVPAAASYTVEICTDPACVSLVKRVTGVEGPAWPVEGLPLDAFRWRVSAVSDSGLDGYASEVREVRLIERSVDTTPPTGTIALVGEHVENRGRDHHHPDLRVEVGWSDDRSGVAAWTALVDGAEVEPSVFDGPWRTGDYQVGARAADVAGNRAKIGPLAAHVDGAPPLVTLRTGDAELVTELLGEGAVDRKWAKRKRKWTRRAQRRFQRKASDPVWTVLARGSAEVEMASTYQPKTVFYRGQKTHHTMTLAGQAQRLLLLAPDLAAGEGGEPLGERVLLVSIDDERSGVDRITLKGSGSAAESGEPWLELEAVDRLGNRTVERWSFSPSP